MCSLYHKELQYIAELRQRGWLYGMEMDLYKSRFSDGRPDGYCTILYSFLYLVLKGDPNFSDLVIFCFGVEISLYKLI